MAATTLSSLITRTGRELGQVETGTTTGAGESDGSTAVLKTAPFISSARSAGDERFNDAWLRLPSGPSGESSTSEERQIISYTPSTGVVSVGSDNPFSAQVASGAAAEIHTLVPASTSQNCIKQAINDTLEQLEYKDRVSVTIVDNAKQYILTSSLAWLTEESQVLEVYRRIGDTTNQYDYVPYEWTTFRDSTEAPDAVTERVVLVIPPLVSSSTLGLELEARRPYSALNSDASTTLANAVWVALNAAIRILTRVVADAAPSDVNPAYQARLGALQNEVVPYNRRYMIRAKPRMQVNRQLGWR